MSEEMCICGHPASKHTYGECTEEECDCEDFESTYVEEEDDEDE